MLNDNAYGCITQIIILIIWGFIGSWLTGICLNIWFAEHSWFELSLLLRWFVGIFAGKFALVGIIIGILAGVVFSMPIL